MIVIAVLQSWVCSLSVVKTLLFIISVSQLNHIFTDLPLQHLYVNIVILDIIFERFISIFMTLK